MITLVGNPDEVDNGEGDFSEGWIPEHHEAEYANMAACDPHRKAEVDQLVQLFADNGFSVAPAVAYYAWCQVSMSVHAHWLMVTFTNNHVDLMRRFLIEQGTT